MSKSKSKIEMLAHTLEKVATIEYGSFSHLFKTAYPFTNVIYPPIPSYMHKYVSHLRFAINVHKHRYMYNAKKISKENV